MQSGAGDRFAPPPMRHAWQGEWSGEPGKQRVAAPDVGRDLHMSGGADGCMPKIEESERQDEKRQQRFPCDKPVYGPAAPHRRLYSRRAAGRTWQICRDAPAQGLSATSVDVGRPCPAVILIRPASPDTDRRDGARMGETGSPVTNRRRPRDCNGSEPASASHWFATGKARRGGRSQETGRHGSELFSGTVGPERKNMRALASLLALTLDRLCRAPPSPYGAWRHRRLLHGFMHPIGGLDHVLCMVAVGVFAFVLGGRALILVPLSFVGMMAVGLPARRRRHQCALRRTGHCPELGGHRRGGGPRAARCGCRGHEPRRHLRDFPTVMRTAPKCRRMPRASNTRWALSPPPRCFMPPASAPAMGVARLAGKYGRLAGPDRRRRLRAGRHRRSRRLALTP